MPAQVVLRLIARNSCVTAPRGTPLCVLDAVCQHLLKQNSNWVASLTPCPVYYQYCCCNPHGTRVCNVGSCILVQLLHELLLPWFAVRNAIRCNDHKTLDWSWRYFVPLFRATDKHHGRGVVSLVVAQKTSLLK